MNKISPFLSFSFSLVYSISVISTARLLLPLISLQFRQDKEFSMLQYSGRSIASSLW